MTADCRSMMVSLTFSRARYSSTTHFGTSQPRRKPTMMMPRTPWRMRSAMMEAVGSIVHPSVVVGGEVVNGMGDALGAGGPKVGGCGVGFGVTLGDGLGVGVLSPGHGPSVSPRLS